MSVIHQSIHMLNTVHHEIDDLRKEIELVQRILFRRLDHSLADVSANIRHFTHTFPAQMDKELFNAQR